MRNIKIGRLIRQYREYLLLALVASVIVLLSWLVLLPSATKSIEFVQELSKLRKQADTLVKKRQLLESISVEATINLLREAESALPQEKDTASILISMENLSALTEFAIDDVNLSPGLLSTQAAQTTTTQTRTAKQSVPTPPKAKHGAHYLPVQIQGRGTTTQFEEFLRVLVDSRRIFDIENMSVNFLADTPNFLSVQMDLIAYYLPPITEIGSINAALPQITDNERRLVETLSERPYISEYLIQPVEVIESQTGKENLFTD